jgi:hypothetical protein
MNGRIDQIGQNLAADYAAIADRVRLSRPQLAQEYDALALGALRGDRLHHSEIAWQDERFSAFAPIIADLLRAGKLDPIPATAFLNRHTQGAAYAQEATA